jgi:exodeoxyribonuclease X-like protein/putative quorum-sensing-regulated virulence factor
MSEHVDTVMPFGKYKGKTLGDIADEDLLYLDWLNGGVITSERLMIAVAGICEERRREIESLIDEREQRHAN